MSDIKETKAVYQEVTVAWECDVCHVQTSDKEQYKQEWHHFCEIHQGWGNDSIDSYVYYDACSVDCFIKQLQAIIPDLLEYAEYDAKIADMPVKFAQKLLDRLLESRKQ